MPSCAKKIISQVLAQPHVSMRFLFVRWIPDLRAIEFLFLNISFDLFDRAAASGNENCVHFRRRGIRVQWAG